MKGFAACFGLQTSRSLWNGLALRAYRRKLRREPAFRTWYEIEAPRWTAHWGNGSVMDECDRVHLASQLYELTETLRRRIGPPGAARVLDAGASDGLFLTRIGVQRGVGVNFLVACARKICSDGYRACLADIERLPFADKSFDYVLCCETLEHVRNPIHTLDELGRVCRKRIFLTVPWLPATRINARPAGWPQVESHVFEFSVADFMKVLTHAHLRLLHRESVQVFPEPRNPLVQWWLGVWMYPSYFPRLQYYELEPL